MNQEWKPIHSKQMPHERNCGQHCVSMITGLPVSMISQFLKKSKGTSSKDVAGALLWFGYYCDPLMNKYKGKLPKLCIVHYANHWCLHYDGMIYDSCCHSGPYPLSEATFRIKHYLEVKRTA